MFKWIKLFLASIILIGCSTVQKLDKGIAAMINLDPSEIARIKAQLEECKTKKKVCPRNLLKLIKINQIEDSD